jgi:hypothetical protein
MRKRFEFHRTCQHCGRQWYAPIESAPNGMQVFGMRMQASGQSMSGRGLFGGGGSARARAVQMQAQRDRVRDAARCPDCGSGSFTQTRVAI